MMKYHKDESEDPVFIPSELLLILSPYDFKKRFVSKNHDGLLEGLFTNYKPEDYLVDNKHIISEISAEGNELHKKMVEYGIEISLDPIIKTSLEVLDPGKLLLKKLPN